MDERLPRARGGDVRAFTSLLREHDAAMRALVWSVVRDAWLMDDVLQTAYEKAWRNLETFRGEASFRTWLHRICYTTAVDALRQEARRRHDRLADHEDRAAATSGPATTTIRRLEWDRAWSGLSPDQRAAVVLVVVEGLSYEEAARVCGSRPGTIASRVGRARERLRAVLGEDARPTEEQG